MEEYLGQAVTLIAGLVAIAGGTWNPDTKGLRKITLTGYLTAALLFLGFWIAIHKHKSSVENERKLNAVLSNTNQNTEHLKSKLESYQIDIASYKSRIDAYEFIIRRIDIRNERQIEVVFSEFLELASGGIYTAGSPIYGGSVIKPRGFDCDLQFESGRTRFVMPEADQGEPVEYMVRGYSGTPMSWSLKNLSSRSCSGKLSIESTPRIRSRGMSDVEEITD